MPILKFGISPEQHMILFDILGCSAEITQDKQEENRDRAWAGSEEESNKYWERMSEVENQVRGD